jgi:hypothetical protein
MRPSVEQELLGHVLHYLAAAGLDLPRPMVVDYYVSLKSNPFVILTGARGFGKVETARLFAEAICGQESGQYILIRGGGDLPPSTTEGRGYQHLHTRFGSLRFVEALQEASSPLAEGKAFFICLESLAPAEVETYFSELLYADEAGHPRLRLKGLRADQHPPVPPNVYITATVNDSEQAYQFSPAVLDHASPIEFRLRAATAEASAAHVLRVPPVGYQRAFMRSAVRRVDQAYRKLAATLGVEQLSVLQPSPELRRLLWHAGIPLTTFMLHELTRYVANAFDEHGQGLFDPNDPAKNALKALDSQIAQKVLWRLRGGADRNLERSVEAYLDRLFPYAYERYRRLQQGA